MLNNGEVTWPRPQERASHQAPASQLAASLGLAGGAGQAPPPAGEPHPRTPPPPPPIGAETAAHAHQVWTRLEPSHPHPRPSVRMRPARAVERLPLPPHSRARWPGSMEAPPVTMMPVTGGTINMMEYLLQGEPSPGPRCLGRPEPPPSSWEETGCGLAQCSGSARGGQGLGSERRAGYMYCVVEPLIARCM